MSFITAFFYDRFMAKAEEACLQEWRKDLLMHVQGDVLEIGAGTGASLDVYPDGVNSLVLAEPDKHMRKILKDKAAYYSFKEMQITSDTVEHLSFADASFDWVVASLVFCSVSNPNAGFMEINRVLRPSGNFIFLEHVAAPPGTRRRRWQNGVTPIWRTFSGNCHLNRETETALNAAGFTLKDIKRESMRKAMPIVRPTIRGIAQKVL